MKFVNCTKKAFSFVTLCLISVPSLADFSYSCVPSNVGNNASQTDMPLLISEDSDGTRVITIPENGKYVCRNISNTGGSGNTTWNRSLLNVPNVNGAIAIEWFGSNMSLIYDRRADDDVHTGDRTTNTARIAGGKQWYAKIIEDDPASTLPPVNPPPPPEQSWTHTCAAHADSVTIEPVTFEEATDGTRVITLPENGKYVCHNISNPGGSGNSTWNRGLLNVPNVDGAIAIEWSGSNMSLIYDRRADDDVYTGDRRTNIARIAGGKYWVAIVADDDVPTTLAPPAPQTQPIVQDEPNQSASYEITGPARVNRTLSLTRLSADPDGISRNARWGYQWRYHDNSNGSANNINGANWGHYTITNGDCNGNCVGKYISVQIAYTDGIEHRHIIDVTPVGPVNDAPNIGSTAWRIDYGSYGSWENIPVPSGPPYFVYATCDPLDNRGPNMRVEKVSSYFNRLYIPQGEAYYCSGLPDPGANKNNVTTVRLLETINLGSPYCDDVYMSTGCRESGLVISSNAVNETLTVSVLQPLGTVPANASLGGTDGLIGGEGYRRWGDRGTLRCLFEDDVADKTCVFSDRAWRPYSADYVGEEGYPDTPHEPLSRSWGIIFEEDQPAWRISFAQTHHTLKEGDAWSSKPPRLQITGLQSFATGFDFEKWAVAGGKQICFDNQSLNTMDEVGFRPFNSPVDLRKRYNVPQSWQPGDSVRGLPYNTDNTARVCYPLRTFAVGANPTDHTSGNIFRGITNNWTWTGATGIWSGDLQFYGASTDDNIVEPDRKYTLNLNGTGADVDAGTNGVNWYSIPGTIITSNPICRWLVDTNTHRCNPFANRVGEYSSPNAAGAGNNPLSLTILEDDKSTVYTYAPDSGHPWRFFITRDIDYSSVTSEARWRITAIDGSIETTIAEIPMNISGFQNKKGSMNLCQTFGDKLVRLNAYYGADAEKHRFPRKQVTFSPARVNFCDPDTAN